MLILMACQAQVDPTTADDVSNRVPAKTIYRDDQCLSEERKVELIAEPQVLATWWQSMSAGFLPAKEMPVSLSSIDLERFSVIVLSMGSRPTAGYNVRLVRNDAAAEAGTLVVETEWQSPAENVVLPQRRTKPCIAIKVATGPYDRILIVDVHGKTVIDQNM